MGKAILKMRDKWFYLEYRNPVTDWFVAAQVCKGITVLNAMRRNRYSAPLGEYRIFGIVLPNNELHKIPKDQRNKILLINDVRKIWPEAMSNERVTTIDQVTSENPV
jgi:hypothetical protein